MTRSRTAQIEQFVGDADYILALRIGELIALQEKLNAGPYAVAQRLASGDWRVEDVTETIRLALIGGGLSHKQAADLVRSYVTEGYLFDYATVAGSALYAALLGVEDEPFDEETNPDPLMAPLDQD